jgi:hypothetical protein
VLSAANILQVKPGYGLASLAGGDIVFDSPLQAGSMVVLPIWLPNTATNLLDPVAGFLQTTTPIGGAGTILTCWHRPDVVDGEQSFTATTVTDQYLVWVALEMTMLDRATPLDVTATTSSSGGTISTGTTGMSSADDLFCVAIHCAKGSVAPTISGQTNGFAAGELANVNPPGTVNRIALSSLFPGAAGTFESTATLANSSVALGAMLVFRAVGMLLDTPAEVTS